jgi:hypothetical protein
MAKKIKVIAAPAAEQVESDVQTQRGSRLRTPQFRANLLAQGA